MSNGMFWVLAGAGAAVAIAAGIGVNSLRTNDRGAAWVDSDTDLGAAQTLEELLGWSTVVVTAEYLGESDERVDLASPVDGLIYSYRVDRVMQFRTSSVLRAEQPVGDSLTVRAARSITTWDEDPEQKRTQEFGGPALEQGQEYALFLTRFSETTGTALGTAGPIAIAEIAEGRLRFLPAESSGVDGDMAPPLLKTHPSIAEVAALAANPPQPREWPTVDPSSSAMVYGERLTSLADGLQQARASSEVDALLADLRLGPGQIGDRTICQKVEVALATSGWPRDLKCP